MSNTNVLKKYKTEGVLSLKNIRYDHVFQRNVMKNNKSSGKVCVPLDLVGKKVYVVCLVEES